MNLVFRQLREQQWVDASTLAQQAALNELQVRGIILSEQIHGMLPPQLAWQKPGGQS